MNSVIAKELKWLQSLIENRIANYFQNDIELLDIKRDFELSPSYYDSFIKRYKLSTAEQKVVALALASYISPDILDIFLTKNKLYDRPFTEFGGVYSNEINHFIPTVRTALFLLCGGDVDLVIDNLKLFDYSSKLYKEGILKLEQSDNILNRQLILSQKSIDYILYGKESDYEYNSNFPASKLTTTYEWEDLILPVYIKEHLEELDIWLRHKDTLLNEWGMLGRISKGYKALFYGPSGTGKTLTVSLLGKRYNKVIYRIDLSQIVSKYIGETEKNLEYIFQIAQNRDWILFFDEADALFSKRTQISSSNDKYANQETAYMLQRIEEYDGMVILASNLKDNFDDAFLRRFQTIIHFPMPEEYERLQLWQKSFSKMADLSSIDLYKVAKEYELSGANIINIVRFASLMAIKRGTNVIDEKDIITSIKREKYKEGKII